MPIYKLENSVPEIAVSTFIAPNATIIGKTTIMENASIWFNAVIRADFDQITIGEDTNIQDLTMCHADSGKPLKIGNRVTIGHNSTIHGCTIEDDCLIGMGTTIMNGATIKRGCIIAAGSVILENTIIEEYSLVMGAPGRIKKKLPKEIIEIIKISAEVYKDKSKTYTNEKLFRIV